MAKINYGHEEDMAKHHTIVLWLLDELPRPTPEKPPVSSGLVSGAGCVKGGMLNRNDK